MQLNYLTKSDFKVAQTCPTKLYYRKKGYPTQSDGGEYLAMLAGQGYLVEALARALYPDGRSVGYRGNVESAAWETMAALSDSCTLFEATFISRGKMARADILVRRGDLFELIEVKSRGFDREKNDELVRNGRPNLFRATRNPAEIHAEWRSPIEDAAFQVSILQDVFPNARIIPYLLMPDTSRSCPIDGLHHRFALRSLSDTADGALPPSAEYTAEPREIRRSLLLARVSIEDEVQSLLPAVRRRANIYSESVLPTLRRLPTPISTHCNACEYRVSDGDLRGFHECWGELADLTPHILDLYHVGDLGGHKESPADKLITQGKARLYDIPDKQLARRNGSIGERAKRQRLQINHTRANTEWVSAELGAILDSLVYPLHFVDFETCAPAIPRYRGMWPFETIAFQWSCQTLTSPDAEPQHSEWLQTADTFPNAAFAGALRRQLGDSGSIFVWASHEAAVMATIRRQLAERGEEGSEISTWLGEVLANGRLIDMNSLTLKHYFHPRMSGRTSLKIVGDVVWRANPSIRGRLPQYAQPLDTQETENGPVSPYKALPPLLIGDREVLVAEGSGAVLAYYAMMERSAASAILEANRWRHLLRQYCRLDTLAMVMVWWHWRQLIGQLKQ